MAHDYGLDGEVNFGEFAYFGHIWEEKPGKHVTLVNVRECQERITVSHVRECLEDIGLFVWKDLLALWLVEAIVKAIDNGQEEADISKLFTCELHGSDNLGPLYKSQERVICFLMGRLFECLEENDEMMRVRIIQRCIY